MQFGSFAVLKPLHVGWRFSAARWVAHQGRHGSDTPFRAF
jgi:hypothetical protein